ncbi:MAG TPA: N-acetylmuramoyl-L-alanine amidase, partial [Burkholderiales bacterium]
ALLALPLAACAPLPQRAGIPTQWRASPNHDDRRPGYVILHHTGSDTAARGLQVLTDSAQAVSAHYLIAPDGTIYQLVDERARAWHAGSSRWGPDTDINSLSLGIELVNDGEAPYPDAQIAALLALLGDIKRRHHIPAANFLGHADVAPRRKADPGRNFPWRTLAAQGFGLWCDPPLPQPPSPFDTTSALQALGYDVSDPEAAIRAFKLHYVRDGSPAELNEEQQGLLYCLLQRSRE